ncbi:MAG: protein translocase subunit SecD [Candidatus Aminicenantes bacterium]|nr:protein translocase subunit SecD [Candidatus Aminicenantes bacterium]
MRKNLLAKVILVLVVMGTAFILGWPPKKIPLGLDLAGGMHLVFQVQTDDAIEIYVDQTIGRLKELLARKKITVRSFTKKQLGRFALTEFSPDDEGKIRDLLDEYLRDWDYGLTAGAVNLTLKHAAERTIRTETVDQALATINNRVDLFGVSEPTIQRQGGTEGDRIVVELPGISNPERAMNLIRTTALLEWKLVHAGPAAEESALLQNFGSRIPEDMEIVKGDPKKTEGGFYLVSRIATITGQDLSSVHLDRDEMDNPAVGFELKPDGAARFGRLTGENIGKPVAIILDGKVQSAPTIQDRISDRGIIRGRFSIEEVRDLIVTLKSGALPASIKILENRTIGPSLGADSIRRGLIAILASFLITLVFMVFYYRGAGINALVALLFNLVIIVGTLGALVIMKIPVSLTLPGIAGIILTIGMSVDANVLIFERIREELKSGRSVPSSIGFGFSRALSAIIDSNVTTVIAAFFLIQWGTGPIKGFAVTLIIGVLASLFTAVFVSRLIFDLVVPRHRKTEKLSI